jgi:hypothetical protein
MHRIIRFSAWLCLSLMLWTVLAEPTHNHPNRVQSSSCSICMLAHSASPVSTSPARPIFSAIGLPGEEKILAEARLEGFELVIRGPPVA